MSFLIRRQKSYTRHRDGEIEEDPDDQDDPFSTRPPSLDDLQKCTGFNRKWLMFLYRNFKQHCSNGRMSDQQWREVVRLVFPNSADDQFADRLYKAITRDRGQEKILFKDLVMCLWELTESGRHARDQCHLTQQGSTTANFVFGLLGPDAKGRVSEMSFVEYVRCVFALGARKHGADHQLGLPQGSIYRTKSCEEEVRPASPLIRRYAQDKFREMDHDGDGFLRVEDIEREIEGKTGTLLLSTRDCQSLVDTEYYGSINS